jgi:hypothetical protein
MALQREARARRLYKLLLAAAVQSRRPDLIECGDLPALALQRDKLAVATARRRGRDRVQGAETQGAEAERIFSTVGNTYKTTARYTIGNTFIYVLDVYACILLRNTCIYMHILTYVLPISVGICNTGNTCIYCCRQGNILLIGSHICAHTYIYCIVRIIYFMSV